MTDFRAVLALVAIAAPALAQVTRAMEPDLGAIALSVLATARERPEALWTFLIDPDTPYAQALAAADRCSDVFSLGLLEPLYSARAELRREWILHRFGLVPPPEWSTSFEPRGEVARERVLLGRAWTLPAREVPYPATWDDAVRAPWPWRVMQVVDRAVSAIAPPGNELELPRTRAWLAECMSWRIDTDERAEVFFEATHAAWHTKTLPVLARWRRILLDPATPRTAERVAGALGEAHRQLLWGDADGRLACQLIAADALTASPHDRARVECGYQLRALSRRCGFVNGAMPEERAPLPAEAIAAAADLAVATGPTALDPWTRLYVYAFSVCEAVPEPPFAVDRGMGSQSPRVATMHQEFAKWWQQQRSVVDAELRARSAAVTKLRAQLEEAGR